MKNSNVHRFSKHLNKKDRIQEGDLFWTHENDTILWLEVSKDYWGKEYDPELYTPMRRPITLSREFICSQEEKTDTYLNT